jgi:hypothetical protein
MAVEKAQKAMKEDLVTVYGTGKVRFMEAGKSYKVQRIHGENLVKNGSASAKAPEKK